MSIAEYLVGPPSKSGVDVTNEKALAITGFWRAINILAGVVASMPLDVYQVDDDDNATKKRTHAIGRILRKSPNMLMTKFDFMQTLVTHLYTTGNFYARIDRDGMTGYAKQVHVLQPDRVEVKINSRNEPVYVYTKEDNTRVGYSFDRVIHVSGIAWNDLKGLNIVDLFKDVLGTALSNQDYIATFYQNGAMVSGVVTVPQKLTDEAYKRLYGSWNATYGGATNAGKTAILEQGATYAKTGSNPAEAGYGETKKSVLSDIARITGVPQFLLEDLDRATFNNIEHLGQLFVNYTVMPLCENIAQEFSRKLLPDAEQDTHEIRIDYSNLTKADREMIVTTTSAANNCLYCVVAHGAILRIYEKKPLVADQVAINYRKADISPRQRAMLDFAMKVCLHSDQIEDGDFAPLHAHGLNDEDIWDIAAITAFFGLSNRMASFSNMMPNPEFYLMGRVPKQK